MHLPCAPFLISFFLFVTVPHLSWCFFLPPVGFLPPHACASSSFLPVFLSFHLFFSRPVSPFSFLFFALSDISQDSDDEDSQEEQEEDISQVQFGSRYTTAWCVLMRVCVHACSGMGSDACSSGSGRLATNRAQRCQARLKKIKPCLGVFWSSTFRDKFP